MRARSFTKLIFVAEVGAKLRRPLDALEAVPFVVDCLDRRPGSGPRGVAEDSRLLLAALSFGDTPSPLPCATLSAPPPPYRAKRPLQACRQPLRPQLQPPASGLESETQTETRRRAESRHLAAVVAKAPFVGLVTEQEVIDRAAFVDRGADGSGEEQRSRAEP
jgi:hypothetical protein